MEANKHLIVNTFATFQRYIFSLFSQRSRSVCGFLLILKWMLTKFGGVFFKIRCVYNIISMGFGKLCKTHIFANHIGWEWCSFLFFKYTLINLNALIRYKVYPVCFVNEVKLSERHH